MPELSDELRRVLASSGLQAHNVRLFEESHKNSWWLLGLWVVVLVLVGVVLGMHMSVPGLT
jgi:hypothetical protein